MKKNLLLLFAAFATLVANAQTKVEIDGIYYNIISETDKTAEVTYKGDDPYQGGWYFSSITLPTTVTYNGVEYSVTSIGESAFCYCSSLTAINIPESVTSIGESAFYGCSSLTAITIPEGVTSIEHSALGYCSSLTTIVVAEGNKVYDSRGGCNAIIETSSNTLVVGCAKTVIPESVTSIGKLAFHSCSSLTDINIPESVTSIGSEAFYSCSSLTDINIPEGVTSIGELAFSYCSSLTDINIPESVTSIEGYVFFCCSSLTDITIPEGVTSIGGSAFRSCSSLTDINIPEGVTSIGDMAFYDCPSLTDINIPENVTSIGEYAFYGCSSLTAITIPEGVTSIERWAFDGCSSLTDINIPESVTGIYAYAFRNCSSLNTIVLPKNVERVSTEAFANCSGLTDVYCYAETVPSTEADAFDGSYIGNVTLHVPTGAINDYKSTAPWSGFGKFETTSIAVEIITLSKSSATLTAGEKLTLTATVAPNDAEDLSITWSSSNPNVATVDKTGKVAAIAPGTATITATANDGSGVSASCKITVKERNLGKCTTPTISYKDGKVTLACKTRGAKVITIIAKGNDETREEKEFDYIPTQTLTAYATRENYEDSDPVSLTLCWVPCTENHEEDNGILTIPSTPVLISTQGGTITVSGLDAGTAVAAYSTAGTSLATATATDGTATLATNLEAGSIAIVKIGNYSIKVAIK